MVKEAIDELIARLGDLKACDDPEFILDGDRHLDEGEVASIALIEAGEAAVPALLEATLSKNWIVRYRALDALGIMGVEKAANYVNIFFSDALYFVRLCAISALLNRSVHREETIRLCLENGANLDANWRSFPLEVLCLCITYSIEQTIAKTSKAVYEDIPGFARKVILSDSLSYPLKRDTIQALKVIYDKQNPPKRFASSRFTPEWVCSEIQNTGTTKEKQLAEKFLQHRMDEKTNLRASYDDSASRPDELLRAAGYAETPEAATTLLRGASQHSSSEAVAPVSVDKNSGWFQRLLGIGKKSQPAVIVPKPQPLPPVIPYSTQQSLPEEPILPSFNSPTPSRGSIIAAYRSYTALLRRGNPSAVREMITIPAGQFLMGSSEYDSEKGPNGGEFEVFLDTYSISKYPVTVAQFRKFTEVTRTEYDWEGPKPRWGWIDDHPMVKVTWDEARAFCQWAGGDLPTEAQWEKAARGTDGRTFPWGNDWEGGKHCANSVASNNLNSTVKVGSYPSGVSPYGVHDMSGNVWEWCLDYYNDDYYKTAPRNNPVNLKQANYRVVRGGSWNNYNADWFRTADRDYGDGRTFFLGFRVVVQDS